jgi:GTP-binding protein
VPQMHIKEVQIEGSFVKVDDCPKEMLPEFAFIGRSNVGKSSLINCLIRMKDMARISKQPGKTQQINVYNIDKKWKLIDLPGYGYAKVSIRQREKWEKMIKRYMTDRAQLVSAFVLIDSRHELQKNDLDFINWMGENHVPFAIVYTKADKTKQNQLSENLKSIKNGLRQHWDELPLQFVTSAETGEGREAVLDYIIKLAENA